MKHSDLRVICTALGFMAVVSNDGRPEDQPLKAKSVARLIESFCFVTVPNELGVINAGDIRADDVLAMDRAIEDYKVDLMTNIDASLKVDHNTLLKYFDHLLVRQSRFKHRKFYDTSETDVLAEAVRHLVELELNEDGEES